MRTAEVFYGTPVVPGVTYAPAAWIHRLPTPPATAPEVPENQREQVLEDFKKAADQVAERLLLRSSDTQGDAAEVLHMTASLAQDRSWRRGVEKSIRQGVAAVQATVAATEVFVEKFEKIGGLMAERITDLRDIRDRVVAELQGDPEPGLPTPSHPVVLLSDDLAPADAALLDPHVFLALVTEYGGPTSHTAIIARQMGIPCIVAARKIPIIPEGEPLLVDGTQGTIELDCDPDVALERVEADKIRREKIRSWRGPAKTKDGVQIPLLANVQDGAGAQIAAAGQGEGIGLFRTELCFLGAHSEPDIDAQAKIYAEVLAAFPHRKTIIRTLDSGSDKPVPFVETEEEANPALGVRGIRTSGRNKTLLTNQIEAIAQAQQLQPESEVWIMAPMISTLPETRWFAALAHEHELKAGIMVEVPAAAILAEQFLSEVDFVSIGTNDLTQYVMAADRMSAHLAEYTDPWQPAILNLIAYTADAGKRLQKPVSVCGEAAADPILACVLVGMGVSSLSMATTAIPAVGSQLSEVTLAQCQAAAQAVKTSFDAKHARLRALEALA